jgi:hypothetical protein
MKMTAQKRIETAARNHISGCIGEASPADAFERWEVGDLPKISGRSSDQVRALLAQEIKRQIG